MNKACFFRYWRNAQPDEMIDCPYQPGNLKISKKSCLKRLRASKEGKFKMVKNDDFFFFMINEGLTTCKNCPAGN